jgi:hypothetical protein
MRRSLALLIVLAGLGVPAAAEADVLDVYQRLASRNLSPAPLVPTVVPPSLRPYDRTVTTAPTRRGRGYALRIVREGTDNAAVVVVTGGEFKTMRALLRDHRRSSFAKRRTRVRGHRGWLLTRTLGPDVRTLAWVERGVVHSVGSGTARTVSLRQLRRTAAKLDPLERDWIGGATDPEDFSEAYGVTTERTITLRVAFEADCAPPGNPDAAGVRVGNAHVTLLPRNGDQFAFDIADHLTDSEEVPWTGTVTGTIAPGSITLDVRATGAFEGDVCDSGALTLTLDRRFR